MPRAFGQVPIMIRPVLMAAALVLGQMGVSLHASVSAHATAAAALEASGTGETPSRSPVTLRLWPHEGFGRIVLDWPSAPDFQAVREENALVFRFGSPAALTDPAALQSLQTRLGQYLTSARLDHDGLGLRLELAEGVTHRAFLNDTSLVIDLRPAASSDDVLPPVIAVRAGTHATFSRLVFDWGAETGYRIARKDSEVSIAFTRPGRLDAESWRSDRSPHILDLQDEGDKDGAKAVLRVHEDARLRSFRSGTAIIIDVLDPAGPAASARREPATSPRIEAVNPAPMPETPVAREPVLAQPVSRPVALLAPADGARDPRALDAAVPVQDLQKILADAAAIEGVVPVLLSFGPDEARLQFLWDSLPAAAVFRRGSTLWVVFDQDAPMRFEGWDGDRNPPRRTRESRPGWAAELGTPQRSRIPGTAIVRMALPEGVFPHARRDGENLVITLNRRVLNPSAAVPVESRFHGNGEGYLHLTVREAPDPIRIGDEEVGDTLWVVPLAEPGLGLPLTRRYAELEILETAQGIVLRPLVDSLAFSMRASGLEVGMPGGLNLSGTDAPLARHPAGSEGRSSRLLEIDRWRSAGHEGFVAQRHALLRRIALAPPAERDGHRLDLARLFFAFGHHTDTLGLLQIIAEDAPALAIEPAFRGLRGAARFQRGDLEGARDDLFHPTLDPFVEAALWRGAVAAAQGSWGEAASLFRRGEPHLETYPADLRFSLGLMLAEAAIRTGDLGLARYQIERLAPLARDARRRAHLALIRGMLLEQAQDPEGALDAYERAIGVTDPKIRVRATLAWIALLRRLDQIDDAGAALALEPLRLAWRGDALEFTILSRLGQALLGMGDVKSGLITLREAVRYFPNHPETDSLIDRMREAFLALYLEDGARRMEPVIALALYDEFRELTPAGPVGDRLVKELSERLIAVDLLDRAASLMLHLVDQRLSGTARLDAANRLALVYLLDRKPERALEILTGQLPSDIAPEAASTRRLLTARALGELARYAEALQSLGNDTNPDALRLKGEIHWRTRDWAAAARAYRGLLAGSAPQSIAEDPSLQRAVLSLGISLALDGGGPGLTSLRQEYGPALQGTPYEEAFVVITSNLPPTSSDYRRVTEKIAEVDQFEAFLQGYRERLFPAVPRPGGGPGPEAGLPVGTEDSSGRPLNRG